VKLLYKPLGVLLGVVGGLLAGAAFKQVWRRVGHDEDTPNATDRERGWAEVLIAAGLEGAIFGAVKALVDRAGATGYARVTGVWPGDEESKHDD
jgi:predicted metal-dependent enzyme (double-stranded beta helix superfamily)